MNKGVRWSLVLLLGIVLTAGAVAGEVSPLFQIDTKKPVERVILDDAAGIAVMCGERDLAAYRLENGEKLLAVQDKFVSDLFSVLSGQRYLVTAVDKGKSLRGYDLQSGQQAWEKEAPAKLKSNDVLGVYDTPAGLLLHVKASLYCIDPASGDVKWTADGLNLSPQVLRQVIYAVQGDFGLRLIGLGAPMSHQIYVLDGETGQVVNTLPYELGLSPKPVIRIGGGRLAILHGGGVSGVDAATGQEQWTVEGKLTGSDILKKLTVNGVSYALFGFAENLALVNLDEGTLTYKSGKDVDLAIQDVQLKDGTLVVLGLRDMAKKRPDEINNNGGMLLAYGVDVAGGSLAWGPVVLANSAVLSLAKASQTIGKLGGFMKMAQGDVAGGLGQMKETKEEARTPTTYTGYSGPYEVEGDLVYHVWAEDARVITDNASEWVEGPGEGLVRINPATGEVVWRTQLTLYNSWEKPLKRMLDKTSKDAWSLKKANLAPLPVFSNGFAYVPAGGSVAKIDLQTGKIVWSGPDHEFISKVFVAQGSVAAVIGGGRLHVYMDLAKDKLTDASGETKVNGLQVLDDASGNETAFVDFKHAPATLLSHYDEETNAVYLVSGETARRINLATGKVVWEKPLKKVTGEIEGKNSAMVQREQVWVSSEPAYYGFFDTAAYEAEKATAKVVLGSFWCRDNSVVVLGPDGPAKIDRDGKVAWEGEWSWDPEKAKMAPTITNMGILCQLKNTLQFISLKDGKTVWTAKVSGDASFALDKKKSRVIVMDKKSVTAYKI